MTVLEAPGARLRYDVQGSGPLISLIPGAGGDARAFSALAEHLASHYTVATYDRRGFSRSTLIGSQDYSHRLDTDADDAHRVILGAGHQSATIFGTSSGALVALHLLARHPEAVSTFVAYEPPAVRLLRDGEHWIDLFEQAYDLCQSVGAEPALHLFRDRTFAVTDRQAMTRAMDLTNPQVLANVMYWFDHELRHRARRKTPPLQHRPAWSGGQAG